VETDHEHRILAIRSGSAAADAGLRIGDRILKLDNKTLIAPMTLEAVLSLGEEVTIDLERPAPSASSITGLPPVPGSPSTAKISPSTFNPPTVPLPPPALELLSHIESMERWTEDAREPQHEQQKSSRSLAIHGRRASAPPGLDKLAARARASLGMPPMPTGEAATGSTMWSTKGDESPKKPDSAMQKLRGWWAERASRQQAAANKGAIKAALPMPTFLEDAFSTESFGSIDLGNELGVVNDGTPDDGLFTELRLAEK